MTQPLIPDHLIDAAERVGACREAIEILHERAWPVAEFASCYPRWIRWWFCAVGRDGDTLRDTVRLLLHAGRRTATLALRYGADKLTPAEIDEAAGRVPGAVIRYAGWRLSDETLGTLALRAPREALRYKAHRLAPETLWACAVLAPSTARRDRHARRCLEALPPAWRALIEIRARQTTGRQ